MKKITVNQLAKGLYLVKTDGSEGHNFPPIFKSLSWQLEAAGFVISLAVEPIGDSVDVVATPTDVPKRGRPLKVKKPEEPKFTTEQLCLKLLHLVVKEMTEDRFLFAYRWDKTADRIYVPLSSLIRWQAPTLEKQWDKLMKSADLKHELLRLGLLDVDTDGAPTIHERKVNKYPHRVGYMVAIKVPELTQYLESNPIK